MGGIFNFVINNPFTAPITAPTAMQMISTNIILLPGNASMNFPAITAHSAIVDEMERSMPAVIITGSIPNAIMP